MNRAEIVAAVKSYLNRPNLKTSDVTSWIPVVEAEISRELKEHPRSQYRTSFTQPAGNEILRLPTNMMSMILLRNGDTDEEYTQYGQGNRDNAKAAGCAFIPRGDCVELFPTPAQDTVFKLDYIGALFPLQSDLSTNWVSIYFPDLYIYGCLKEATVFLKDDKRLAQWTQEFYTRLEATASQGWNQNIGSHVWPRSP